MESIEKVVKQIVDSIPIEELLEKDTFCERCLLEGMDLEISRYNRRDKMQRSEVTGDLICEHCYEVESEEGYKRMNKKQRKAALEFLQNCGMDEFEKYRNIRLDEEYYK